MQSLSHCRPLDRRRSSILTAFSHAYVPSIQGASFTFKTLWKRGYSRGWFYGEFRFCLSRLTNRRRQRNCHGVSKRILTMLISFPTAILITAKSYSSYTRSRMTQYSVLVWGIGWDCNTCGGSLHLRLLLCSSLQHKTSESSMGINESEWNEVLDWIHHCPLVHQDA